MIGHIGIKDPLRVLVCGDRNWTNKQEIEDIFTHILCTHDIDCVIEGEARGADTLGREVANFFFLPVLRFPALWDKHGRAAGPIRNQQMLDEGKPNLVLAFHENLHASKGTKDMVTRALKANILVWLITGNQVIEDFKWSPR